MIEVEVKFRISDGDYDRLHKLLNALASALGKETEIDIYFNHPCRDFQKTDEAIRVRVYGTGKATLTYKGPRLASRGKARIEYNVDVEPTDTIVNILTSLGFTKVAEIKKERVIFTYENYTIYLDKVEGLGSFLEVETMTSDAGLSDKLAGEIIGFVKNRLGISESSIEPKTYLELYLAKQS